MRVLPLTTVVGFGAAAAAAASAAAKHNFIFFQPDEMRAEALGCYGHPVAKTPNVRARGLHPAGPRRVTD